MRSTKVSRNWRACSNCASETCIRKTGYDRKSKHLRVGNSCRIRSISANATGSRGCSVLVFFSMLGTPPPVATRHESAIHENHLTGDKIRGIGGEEDCQTRQVFRLSPPIGRGPVENPFIRASSRAGAVISVRINPGATPLTWMLCSAHSTARSFVN